MRSLRPVAGSVGASSSAVPQARVALTISSGAKRQLPAEFMFGQNYPNPFNPSTAIAYALPTNARVRMALHNMLGQQVALLVDAEEPAGWRSITFSVENLPSGVYIYRLAAGKFSDSKKLVVLR